MTSTLQRLLGLGQSVWLDDLRREYLEDGTLANLIGEDGVSGVTTNPAIFERAIQDTVFYEAIIAVCARYGEGAERIYERLVIEDVQQAADLLAPTYAQTESTDGYVSLEVSPHLADDGSATVTDAKRLWSLVDRPNLMIKVPATRAGFRAIEALIAAGINVNATLLFSVTRYREVLDAYWRGLETRVANGQSTARLASVASFFISRIDTVIDRQLESEPACMATGLRGKAAIASAKCAYQVFRDSLDEPRWQALASVGAKPQRLLWASTSSKDPAYSDVKYVEELIGPGTVTTLPMQTLLAYRDHGDPHARVADGLDRAKAISAQLAALDIDLEAAAQQLEREGIRQFADAYDRLIARIEVRRGKLDGAMQGVGT